MLQLILAGAIAVPLICLLLFTYLDHERRFDDANDATDRLARVAEEQAVKVFDLNSVIQAQVVDVLNNDDGTAIRQKQKELYERLNKLGGGYPQVSAISVFDADGALLVTSRIFPAPPFSVANREDFVHARELEGPAYISHSTHAPDGESVFCTTVARMDAHGKFLGVVTIALRRRYFSTFYRELQNGNPALALGLFRSDAHVLARFPAQADNKIQNPASEFAHALGEGQAYGQFQLISSIDGLEKYVSFRKVAGYPLYVSAGMSIAAIRSAWLQDVLLASLIALVPSIISSLLVFFSLRQLATEQAAWERWQAEVAMRMSAEASSRQLQRMSALGNLIANVAHDFNNLLMVVTANMTLIKRRHFSDIRREIDAIETSVQGGEALGRRLLSVARKRPLKRESIDLNDWIITARVLVNAAVGARINVQVNLPPDLWCVLCDATELESAALNLATNARDAIPSGGLLVIRAQNISMTTTDGLLPAGEYVLLSFTDNGVGMSEAVRQRAFEPLFTTKSQDAGTGLGLSQVLSTCEQSGGSARIDSTVGKGTTVRLYLPKSRQPATLCKSPTTEHLGSEIVPSTRSVLLVEDNEGVAAGIQAVLETFGCLVQHQLTADAAYAALESGEKFDVILSDVQMPGNLNGIDLATRVRAKWPAQQFGLMTGYTDEMARARAMRLKVFAKPFDIEALARFVSLGEPPLEV
ncbi:hybrid sensor histidine kinase/response regulator [Burkholderia sp. Leaf177]|uniref:hybrid sensor histidine kinase/response regulator n=1 Tax=Burkholderia sp. Leaf177 TaxID=1736287 RepID=UPI0009E72F78|nr:hybrid sensor histidine kinase/response regulator [Burkholderia sp. Leaf177]